MKLQQLRYILEVANNDFNVSATAQNLFTSQPGISKQIRLLEDELGIEIFIRNGKHFQNLTPAGEEILKHASIILDKVDTIKQLSQEFSNKNIGSLSIATTHTQARYALPPAIENFIQHYPDVSLHMHQGTPIQISELAASGKVDFAIATEALELFSDLLMMPCYEWNRCIVVKKDHPLAICMEQGNTLTLEEIVRHPIVTYVHGFTGRSRLDHAFKSKGLEPKVVFTATDADVIKTYVRLGLGIGIIARMAFDDDKDKDLLALDASHLFAPSVTKIGFKRQTFLRGYMFDFISTFAPHLTREIVEAANQMNNQHEVDEFFTELELPCH